MTTLIVEIEREADLQAIIPILERLHVRFRQETSTINPLQEALRNDILQGLPEHPDFEHFVKAFEESRTDRALPFLEN